MTGLERALSVASTPEKEQKTSVDRLDLDLLHHLPSTLVTLLQ
jgi:hypothetical protein